MLQTTNMTKHKENSNSSTVDRQLNTQNGLVVVNHTAHRLDIGLIESV